MYENLVLSIFSVYVKQGLDQANPTTVTCDDRLCVDAETLEEKRCFIERDSSSSEESSESESDRSEEERAEESKRNVRPPFYVDVVPLSVMTPGDFRQSSNVR